MAEGQKQKKYFDNPYDDYIPHKEKIVRTNGKLHLRFSEELLHASDDLLMKFDTQVRELKGVGKEDISVYTGISGFALLYMHVADKLNKPEYLQMALGILEKALPKLKNRCPSFLKGDAGPLALCAVVCKRLGMHQESSILVDRLKALLPLVKKSDTPDEVLYGRAGYLYSLLYLNKALGENTVGASFISEVVTAILNSGKKRAIVEKRVVPLMFKWYDDYYLGAAHGLSGILYMLLQARRFMSERDLHDVVRPTVEFIRQQRLHSGHYPAVLGETRDRGHLVQWCHGAPGITDIFALAFKDLNQLHRACKFAQWCETYGRHQNQTPDRPFSLFEGVAGAIYFLIDMQHPEAARFPAYAL